MTKAKLLTAESVQVSLTSQLNNSASKTRNRRAEQFVYQNHHEIGGKKLRLAESDWPSGQFIR